MILIDNNLSYKLKFFFENQGIKATHVENCGLQKDLDERIWEFAKKEGYIILSKDFDFVKLYNRFGHPPKVIVLACGNLSTLQIENLIKTNWKNIQILLDNPEIGIIEVS